MRLPQRSSKAFTLIELIVVIVILGILALIAIPTFGKVISKSQDESTLTTLRSIARDAQALRALDQGATWGTSPADAITETSSNAAGVGTYAAGQLKATSDAGVDPAKGEVTYKVVDSERMALSTLSPSGRICMVGLSATVVGTGKCVLPSATTGPTPTSTLAGQVQSDTTILPVASGSSTPGSNTPGNNAPAPVANPGAFTLTVAAANGKANLSWTASSDATSYKVERSAKSDFSDTVVVLAASQAALTYQDAAPTGTWYYRVTAGGVAGSTPVVRTGVATLAPPVSGVDAAFRQYGSAGNDYAQYSTMGADGTLYVVGYTSGALTGTNAGGQDAFVMALNPDGTRKWTKQYGTTADDYANGIVLGSDGTLYVGGYTSGTLGSSSFGSSDVFIQALNASDGSTKWINQYGGAGSEIAQQLALGSDGTLYVAGYTTAAFGGTNAGSTDTIVLAVNSGNGSQKWVKQYGGTDTDYGRKVLVGSDGTIYSVGITYGSMGPASLGDADIYVQALNPADGTQKWLKNYGTNFADLQRDATIGPDGTLYIAAYTAGSLVGSNAGGNDVILLALNPDGSQKWAKQYGSAGADNAYFITYGSDGNLYLGGASSGDFGGTNGGGFDTFAMSVTTSGTQRWLKPYASAQADYLLAGSYSSDGKLYAVGYSTGSFGGNPTSGGADIIVIKIS